MKKKGLVGRIRRWGHRRPIAVEAMAGFLLLLVPIPEPTLEIATDVAGVGLMADAVRRAKKK